MGEVSRKLKRTALDINQKQQIIAHYDKTKASQQKIADYFSELWSMEVKRRTVGDILNHREKWLSIRSGRHGTKRIKLARHGDLEESLWVWFSDRLHQNVQLTDETIRAKAKEYGRELGITNFSYSNGWLHRFKQRYGINRPLLKKGTSHCIRPSMVSAHWNHAKIGTLAVATVNHDAGEDDDDDDDDDDDTPLAQLVNQAVKSLEIDPAIAMSAIAMSEEYVVKVEKMDEPIMTQTDTSPNSDIVDNIKNDDHVPLPSRHEVDKALAVLLRHIESTPGMTEDDLALLTGLQKAIERCRRQNAKQLAIKNFIS